MSPKIPVGRFLLVSVTQALQMFLKSSNFLCFVFPIFLLDNKNLP